MNSPKGTGAGHVQAERENERGGTNADRQEQDRERETDEDDSAEPLLGTRHGEDEDELPLSDDGSGDLHEDK